MHFTKTLVSMFALASFTSAFSYEADEQVDVLAARKVEFLQARAEYIKARDNYLMEKRGGFISKPSGAVRGDCLGTARPYTCTERLLGGKTRPCGPCKPKTGFGEKCDCTM